MEFIKASDIKELSNPGVVSRQLLNPENSTSKRVTITEVHLVSGASQPRHTHDASEQIWYATKGSGKLLLADDKEKEFKAGDVARFADKDVHGLLNDGDGEFVYVSLTAPPINFGYAYKENTLTRRKNEHNVWTGYKRRHTATDWLAPCLYARRLWLSFGARKILHGKTASRLF